MLFRTIEAKTTAKFEEVIRLMKIKDDFAKSFKILSDTKYFILSNY